MRVWSFLLSPFIYIVQRAVWFLGRLLGLNLETYKPFISREDVESMVHASGESGALEEDERRMISGVIAFEETRVSEIMVPRTDMKTIPSDTTVEDASKVFLETGHSRIPF